jgi:large subunit ribosomal protein L9
MKVALLVDLPNIGKAGDIKEVSDGYAKNFLIPHNKALPATKGVVNYLATNKKGQSQKRARYESGIKDITTSIDGKEVVIESKAGPKGRLYGSVTNADIADALEKFSGHSIDKRKLEIEEAIRSLGSYQATYKPLPKLIATFTVTVKQKETD